MIEDGRVIIVEDDIDLRDSLVEFLTLDGHRVVGVGSCLEFYRAISESHYSIAVIDVGLPDQSGFVLAEYIRKNTSMGVIILTARDSVDDRLRGYDTGADQYLVKPVECRELAAVLTNLKSRLMGVHPATPSHPCIWQLDRRMWRLLTPKGDPVPLTPKEMHFITCLAEAACNPVSRGALLTALNYRDDEYARRAMDSLIRRLRRKIETVSGKPQPVKTIHNIGYCFSAPITIL